MHSDSFQYLLAVGFTWLLCYILTITNAEPPEGAARTDKNQTTIVLREAPWFRVPYPGQWGSLIFHAGTILGFIASIIAAIVESVGNYSNIARVSDESLPPLSAVNRAILVEGVGCALAALMGVGVGVTTYSENIGAIGITKVASRITMQIAGVMMILLGLFTKVGAILATIPDALVGSVLTLGMSMVAGVGISSLQQCDMRLSRNVGILGVSIMVGNLVPLYFTTHPVNTGVTVVDDMLNILLTVQMLVGGFVGFVMDNTVPGATRAQRGLPSESSTKSTTSIYSDGYAFPELVNRLLNKCDAIVRFIPFLPTTVERQKIVSLTKVGKLTTNVVVPVNIDNVPVIIQTSKV